MKQMIELAAMLTGTDTSEFVTMAAFQAAMDPVVIGAIIVIYLLPVFVPAQHGIATAPPSPCSTSCWVGPCWVGSLRWYGRATRTPRRHLTPRSKATACSIGAAPGPKH